MFPPDRSNFNRNWWQSQQAAGILTGQPVGRSSLPSSPAVYLAPALEHTSRQQSWPMLHTLLIIVALLIAEVTATAPSSERPAVQLLSCFTSTPDCASSKTTWATFLEDRPACFKAARVWWEPSSSQAAPVTLVTQLSADRLGQVKAQCATWSGPLAAAVYLPVLNPEPSLSGRSEAKIGAAAAQLDGLFRFTQAARKQQRNGSSSGASGSSGGGCDLRLLLLYELFDEEAALALYPINSLRNYARLMADTPLIANIDVDMLPSTSLSASLAIELTSTAPGAAGSANPRYNPASPIAAAAAANAVYVLPAFETRCGGPAFADTVATSSKAALPALSTDGCVGQMRGRVAPACHNATDFAAWAVATEPYAIRYQAEFEPWFLSARDRTLWYDTRYRGYGKNKIVHVAATAANGAKFMVHAGGFLVHRPHPESKARKQFLRAKFSKQEMSKLRSTVYGHIEGLWNSSKAEMTAGTYVAVVEDALTKCQRSLSWWQTGS